MATTAAPPVVMARRDPEVPRLIEAAGYVDPWADKPDWRRSSRSGSCTDPRRTPASTRPPKPEQNPNSHRKEGHDAHELGLSAVVARVPAENGEKKKSHADKASADPYQF